MFHLMLSCYNYPLCSLNVQIWMKCKVQTVKTKYEGENLKIPFLATISIGKILCSVDRASRYNSMANDQLDAQFFFIVFLFQFSTCFEQPRAHHQENRLHQYNIWYMPLCVGDRPVCRSGSVEN
jgi:hypothetical protein